ncbi:MAG: hypothetical protein JWM68_3210 [Verrucomicrobiales bacterium]|nr:hypothetical protein [Verrucomicrobiales bacterium]
MFGLNKTLSGFRKAANWLCRLHRNASGLLVLLVLVVSAIPSVAALPARLILLLDGVSYRDMNALQEGIRSKDSKGREDYRQGFHQGYFPVTRLVSTFPSISDPAWTEILGNRPTVGYQRTYFSTVEHSEVSLNGVTSLVEYEKQMTGPLDSDARRVMGYLFPLKSFKHEVNTLVENFLKSGGDVTNYYSLIHSTDVAQHLSGDILSMLCLLDEKLQELRAVYRRREGKELEILILSDHGNNHAGIGKRVGIGSFLKKAGYRRSKSIQHPKDIVLPTAGIESWVEMHNSPTETERLVPLLSHLEGVDIVTAQAPDQTNRFIVVNSKQERAVIEWNAEKNSFRYATETGDPLGYRPVMEALAKKGQLDADGFATADHWMDETFTHRYPLALERIVHGHTQAALNPASILISLKNEYVHCEWLIRGGVLLVKSGGTHGGLDDLSSNGILLSSFAQTQDTSTSRVAAQFDQFKGLRNYRAEENGAKWVSGKSLLQIWTPAFTRLSRETPIGVTIETVGPLIRPQIPRTNPVEKKRWCLTLDQPQTFTGREDGNERTYALPADLVLSPLSYYKMFGQIRDEKKIETFKFTFRTDPLGIPLAE